MFHILQFFLIWQTVLRMVSSRFPFPPPPPMFIFIPQHLPILISLSIMPYGSVSSLASSTRPFAYLTVRITCSVLKFPTPSRGSLVRYSLYRVNRFDDKLQKIYELHLFIHLCARFPWQSTY